MLEISVAENNQTKGDTLSFKREQLNWTQNNRDGLPREGGKDVNTGHPGESASLPFDPKLSPVLLTTFLILDSSSFSNYYPLFPTSLFHFISSYMVL